MSSILIIEDECLVAKDIEESLRGLGYQIAGSAASARDALNRAAVSRPDLVLMDIRISGETDGVETARRLRAQYDTPIIYITAYTDSETIERARETEPFGYIVKPFDASELHCAIEIALFRHRMEARIKEREHLFSTTLKSIADAVIAVDPNGAVTFMNAAAEALLGGEGRGRFSEVVSLIDEASREPVVNPLELAIAERTITSVPAGTVLCSTGGEVPIEDSAAPIIDDSGNLLGAVLVFRDIGARRRLEHTAQLAQRMAALGTLSAGIAHEINNPLAYVTANAAYAVEQLTLLRGQMGCHSAFGRVMDRIDDLLTAVRDLEQGADRITRIVSDMKVLGRPAAAAAPVPTDATAALEWAIRVTSKELWHRAVLVRKLSEVPHVLGDESHLAQVFVNLLTNAIHAIPEGHVTQNRIEVSSGTDASGRVVFRVRDTGHGIDPGIVSRIFEPFFTTKPATHSLGLGLALCHSIVSDLGGEIHVEPNTDGGTTFSVVLRPAPRVETRASIALEQPRRRGRILIVDDESLVVDSLRRLLSRSYDADGLTDAEQALAILAADDTYDLVLCDLMMPHMSGMDFHERLSERAPEMVSRVVYMTGGTFTSRATEFMRSLGRPCLEKPLRTAELEEFIQDFLAARAEAPASEPKADSD